MSQGDKTKNKKWVATYRKKGFDTMSNSTKKMTYVDALNAAIAVTSDEVQDKLIQLRDQTIKRNTAERKPTKKQVEQRGKDAEFRNAILDGMESNTLYSADDIAKTLIPEAGLSGPKVTFLMKDLLATDKVVKVVDKRHTFYQLP